MNRKLYILGFDLLVLEEFCCVMEFSKRYLKHVLGGYGSI